MKALLILSILVYKTLCGRTVNYESTAGLTQETLQKPNNRNHLNQEHINHICDPGAQNQS